MEKLIYSKHLRSNWSKDKIAIFHDINGAKLTADEEVLNILKMFKTPSVPGANECYDHGRDEFMETIETLKNNKFLNNAHNDEEADIMQRWIRRFEKNIYTRSMTREVTIVYCCKESEPVSRLPYEIEKICMELHYEFDVWRRPLHIVFLSGAEYEKITKEYSLPEKTTGFVDSRTIIVLNYELFFKSENSHLFYPTIRHECMHVLLGQHRVNIPAWLEEGICEVFSKRANKSEINRELKGKKLISFSELLANDSYNSIGYDLGEISQVEFYRQSQSITRYIMDYLGEDQFVDLIKSSDVVNRFEDQLLNYTGYDFSYFEEKWMAFIQKEMD